jgi:ubiquinone/menaquinone biosynthesis C-methylase UbiE
MTEPDAARGPAAARAAAGPGGVDEQVQALAGRYSARAGAYDLLWSPVIQPYALRLLDSLPLSDAHRVLDVGAGAGVLLPILTELAPGAIVLGVDNSVGMLELARRRNAGTVALMNAEELAIPDDEVDVAVLAFVLFHLPRPERCLAEVFRVLHHRGSVGAATWGHEAFPPAHAVWDDELTKAGARVMPLPATDSRARCATREKMAALMTGAGFRAVEVRTEPLVHQWSPESHHEYQVLATSDQRLAQLNTAQRERCLHAIRERLAGATDEDYTYRGEVLLTTAIKP